MNINITEIVVAVIGLLSVVITSVVVPLLKSKLGTEKAKNMYDLIRIAVKAAEQMIQGSKRGQERLDYVLNFLRENGIDVDDPSVRAAIEAFVYDLNNAFADVLVESTTTLDSEESIEANVEVAGA